MIRRLLLLATVTLLSGLFLSGCAGNSDATAPPTQAAPTPPEPVKESPTEDPSDIYFPEMTALCKARKAEAPLVTRELIDSWVTDSTVMYRCLSYPHGWRSERATPLTPPLTPWMPLSMYYPDGSGEDRCFPADDGSTTYLTDGTNVWSTVESMGCVPDVQVVP